MKLMRVLFVVVALAATAAAIVGWKSASQSRAENEALRAELQRLKEQGAATAEAESAQRAQELQRLRTEAQEVMRLRGEVTQLRSGAKEADKWRGENERLRAENQQLRSSAGAPAVAAPAPAPPPAPAKDQFPKENWAFAGYASPEAALLSAVWAMKEGNPKTYLDSLSPEEQARMAKVWENKSEAEVAAKHQQDVSQITGLRILDRQPVSTEEVVMSVYIEGTARLEKVSMKRIGEEWRVGAFLRNPAK
jgi:regulator of replication initiation timing